jgi:hypothetical protein
VLGHGGLAAESSVDLFLLRKIQGFQPLKITKETDLDKIDIQEIRALVAERLLTTEIRWIQHIETQH